MNCTVCRRDNFVADPFLDAHPSLIPRAICAFGSRMKRRLMHICLIQTLLVWRHRCRKITVLSHAFG